MVKVLVVGGTGSRVGKTELAVGLSAALRRRGLSVQSFKIGPAGVGDYESLQYATGRPCVPLDGWVMDRQTNLNLFHKYSIDRDVCIVEGSNGLFDGADDSDEQGSTAELAKWIGAPVMLVVDSSAVARSIAVLVKGYQQFDPNLSVLGVVLSKAESSAQATRLRAAFDAANVQVHVFGAVPKEDMADAALVSGLGLASLPCARSTSDAEKLGALVEQHIDLSAVLHSAAEVTLPIREIPSAALVRTRVAVAQDAAFAFANQENLALLSEFGAEIVPFSPLEDDTLPAGIAALYFGGSVNAKVAGQLSVNRPMVAAVHAFCVSGGLVYAESGGLMYLSRSLQQHTYAADPMVGLFAFRTRFASQATRPCVAEVTVEPGCPLFPPGEVARGYAVHAAEILEERVLNGRSVDTSSAWTPGQHGRLSLDVGPAPGSPGTPFTFSYSTRLGCSGSGVEPEGYTTANVVASCMHVHFRSNPALARGFVERCCAVDAAHVGSEAAAAADQLRRLQPGPSPLALPYGYLNARGDMRRSSSHPGILFPEGQLSPGGMSCSTSTSAGLDELGSGGHDAAGAVVGPSAAAGGAPAASTAAVKWERPPAAPATTRASGELGWSGCPTPDGERTDRDRDRLLGSGVGPAVLEQLLRLQGTTHNKLIGLACPLTTPKKSAQGWVPPLPKLKHVASGPTLSRDGDGQSKGGIALQPSGSDAALSEWLMQSGVGAGFGIGPGGSGAIAGAGTASNHVSSGANPSPASDRYSSHSFSASSAAAAAAQHDLVSSKMLVRSVHPAQAARAWCTDGIISFSPGATDGLLAMGLGSRLVGVTDLCDRPAGVSVPLVCQCLPALDALSPGSSDVRSGLVETRRQRPQLYLVNDDLMRAEMPGLVVVPDDGGVVSVGAPDVTRALERAGLLRSDSTAAVLYQRCRRLPEVLDFLLQLGRTAAVPQSAQMLVERLRGRLRRVVALTAPLERRPRLLVLEQVQPFVVAARWAAEMKQMAGAADDGQRPGSESRVMSWDEVRAYAPDVIVVTSLYETADRSVLGIADFAGLQGWWSLPAVRGGQVYVVEGALLTRAGPRLVEGVEVLAHILHPQVVAKKAGCGTVLKLSLHGGQRCRQRLLPNYFVPYE